MRIAVRGVNMTHEDGENLYLLELIAVRAQMAQLIKPKEYFQAVDFILDLHKRLTEPVARCEDCVDYDGKRSTNANYDSCYCAVEKNPDGYCDWGKPRKVNK